MGHRPQLTRLRSEFVSVLTDTHLRDRCGIVVGFSERSGGVSLPPYASLNLAGHVGDDPVDVDENRSRFVEALGLALMRDRLVTAQQVHGEAVREVTDAEAGFGAFAAKGQGPIAASDVLVTLTPETPLLMLYADCVPIVLVCEAPRAVAVVHAGWRGALASLPEKAATELALRCGVEASSLLAYVGPHIHECCYAVDRKLLSQFVSKFGNICAVDTRLDLGVVVARSLLAAGVIPEAMTGCDACTFNHAERFFSYRASTVTGRHGALAAITKAE
ncbi:MAG: polyphenol oxidase family protein [Coriobacteriia bacterium]|nr:polyphenol oxidase family protein [Coriobacteriia bacterium]